MNCCIECFCDSEIRSVIKSNNQMGNCDFCSSKNTHIYDISVDSNPVSEMIISLLQIYDVSESIDAKLLKNALCEDWDIFNVGAETIQTLTKSLCATTLNADNDIFTHKVNIPQVTDHEYLNEFGIVRGFSWHEFSESIKYTNRFHSGIFNADAFALFLSIVTKSFPVGSKFYRARISKTDDGYTIDEIGAPPKDKRSAGRINPEGIGALYLSSDEVTVLNEARATTFDYVTLGEFEALRDIKVVNLSGISRTSPFLYIDELEKYAANRKVFKEMAFEIAKPLRRNDSQLEYLPTQYIAEFIKSKGYDGVEYASTLKEDGCNFAMFDETLFECINVKTVEVSEISYKTQPEI